MESNYDDLVEFGGRLSSKRAQAGLTPEHAAAECLLSINQILGLEGGSLKHFYSAEMAFRAGERYAIYLSLPSPSRELFGEPLLADNGTRSIEHLPKPSEVFFFVDSPSGRSRGMGAYWLGLSLTVVIVFTVVLGPRNSGGRYQVDVPVATAGEKPFETQSMDVGPLVSDASPADETTISGSKAGSPVKLPDGRIRSPRRVFIVGNNPARIVVRDASGRVLFDGDIYDGRELALEGAPPFDVSASNPESADVFYLGRRVNFTVPGPDGFYRLQIAPQ